jgi:hypothetical protein
MTAPTAAGPLPIWLARTTMAMTPTQSPRLETNWAMKNRRKFRLFLRRVR